MQLGRALEQGDLLLIDNTTVAHGRRPFTGRREVGRELDVHERAKQALQQFRDDLEFYRVQCGGPSVGSLVSSERGMSKANLSEIFNGKRFPTIDVTVRLVRALAEHAASDAVEHGADRQASTVEARAQVDDWRQRWKAVKPLMTAADKASRQARAGSGRVAADIVATAERQAREILAAAVEEAARLNARAQAWAEKLFDLAEKQALTEIARQRRDSGVLKGDSTARVLALAQHTADLAIAEARREAGRIVEEAQLAAQNTSGMSIELLNALTAETPIGLKITGRVVAQFAEGVLIKIVEPGSGAGFDAYVHTGADAAVHTRVGTLIGVVVDELLARPVFIGRVAFQDPPDSDRWRGVANRSARDRPLA